MQRFCTGLALYFSAFLALFVNPFYLVCILLQLMGQIYLSARSMLLGYKNPLVWSILNLPFEGRWKVVSGGVSRSLSHSWSLLSQRYAYDFIMVDDLEESLIKDAKHHPAWGRSLYAPVCGVVVRVKDGLRDNPAGGLFKQFLTLRSFVGNHIVIRLESSPNFVLLAHLQQKSCIHQVGDMVHVGDYIGRCGNSGLSTEPHLHLQVQDGENFFFAKGLPIAFESTLVYRAHSLQKNQAKIIERGDFVEPVPGKADDEKRNLPEIIEPYPGAVFLVSLFSFSAVIFSVISFCMVIFQWIIH